MILNFEVSRFAVFVQIKRKEKKEKMGNSRQVFQRNCTKQHGHKLMNNIVITGDYRGIKSVTTQNINLGVPVLHAFVHLTLKND